jgi:hypothetical protein
VSNLGRPAALTPRAAGLSLSRRGLPERRLGLGRPIIN